MALRVVFMGTPDFAVPCLSRIVEAGHKVVAVYSQPPRKAGRGMAQRPSPVHQAAEALGVEVRTPLTLRDESMQADFRELDSDVAVVVAYGLLLPPQILQAPRYGCFNMHASKLPRWRGAAPIQRAIMHGDRSTAVAVMKMAEGLDTGPVCLEEEIEISSQTTAGELYDLLADAGAAVMVRALALLEQGRLDEAAQAQEGVTYAAKISKDEARIDFAKPADEVRNHIHGLSPFPGAWFEAAGKDGRRERIKVLRAELSDQDGVAGTVLDDQLSIACGKGAVRLLEIQRAGKSPMTAADFLRGFALRPGDRIQG